jgi:hypothetical protein
MAKRDTNDTQDDVFPRDQLEHYKLELTRLRTENEHLTTEVDYLRQALAAALSKVPQIEASAPSAISSDPDAPQAQSEDMVSYLGTYVKYFSLASLMASPVALLILLMLGLICTIVFFVVLYLLPNNFLLG